MLTRQIAAVVGRFPGANAVRIPSLAVTSVRFASTETTKKKKLPKTDIGQVPINYIGVMADFYIPPKLTSTPFTLWHKMLFRRLGAFVVNTYSIVKYKRETKLPLKFNLWKDNGIDLYVKTNKIFASGCNKRPEERKKYLVKNLSQVGCAEVVNSLVARAESFPSDAKLEWELLSVELNPKVVSFNVLPDANELTSYVQFVMKLQTKQKLTVVRNGTPEENVRSVTDYLVYTLDPFTETMYLAGTLFEADHIRKVSPDEKFMNMKFMIAFTKNCGDIYRANPRALPEKKD